MGETRIEWTSQRLPDGRVVQGYTCNAWSGCTKVILPDGKPDPQCMFCYAEREEDHRRHRVRWGKGRPRTPFKGWRDNLRKWNAKATKEGVRPFVFTQSLSDWADAEAIDAWRDELMDHAERNDRLIYLFLTKRTDLAGEYFHRRYPSGLPDHFWFGFSAGNRQAFATRIADVERVPAAVRFISIEPYIERFGDLLRDHLGAGGLSWLLTGGETGEFVQIAPRIAHSDWYRELRDVAIEAKIPFHFKQHGNFAPVAQSQADAIGVLGAGVSVDGTARLTGTLGINDQGLYLDDAHGIWPPHITKIELQSFLGGSQGKHAHGRMLDGREWHESPEVAA